MAFDIFGSKKEQGVSVLKKYTPKIDPPEIDQKVIDSNVASDLNLTSPDSTAFESDNTDFAEDFGSNIDDRSTSTNSNNPAESSPKPAKKLSMTQNHFRPWDPRLNMMYNNVTQKSVKDPDADGSGATNYATALIGNNMNDPDFLKDMENLKSRIEGKATNTDAPKFYEDMVGSKSVMNPLVMIRYGHLAELLKSNHHLGFIDQEGVPSFSNLSHNFKQRLGEFEQVKVGQKNSNIQLNQTGPNKGYVDTSNLPPEYQHADKNQRIAQDADGNLYYEVDDPNIEYWSNSIGEKITITNDEYKSTRMNYNVGGTILYLRPGTITQEYIDKKIGINYYKLENSIAFFLVGEQGFFRCPDSGEYLYNQDDCTGKGSLKSPTEILEEKTKTELANTRVNLNWSFTGFGKSKQPIEPNWSLPVAIKNIEPTPEELTNPENWQEDPQFLYKWSDFLYCSDYGVKNNRLITLRRFPMPVVDSGKLFESDATHKHMMPVATALTWFGEDTGNSLSGLLDFQAKLEWGEEDANERQDENEIQGNEQPPEVDGLMGNLFKSLSSITQGITGKGGYSTNQEVLAANEWARLDPYKSGKYVNKIFGPVNRITKTKVRKAGLTFDQTLTVNLKYDLLSIGGLNPKAAALEIIANLLALTYTDADFWGGEYRYFPQKHNFPFPGGKAGQDAFYRQDPVAYADILMKDLTGKINEIGNSIANWTKNGFAGIIQGLKGMAMNFGKMLMGKSATSQQNILVFKGLLSGEPIGEWHMVVGNPFNPITMVGNLVCTGLSLGFSDTLGIDDFPDQITATITFEHGMPRDKGGIENMFNRGLGKLHWAFRGSGLPYNNTFSSTDGSDRLTKGGTKKMDKPMSSNSGLQQQLRGQ